MKSSLWMTLSAFFYALQYFNVKLLHAHSDTSLWPVLLCRGVVGFGVALVVVVGRGCSSCGGTAVDWATIGGRAPTKLLVRGMMGALSITGSFLGLQYLRLAVATSLLSTTPLWTAVLVILHKKYGAAREDQQEIPRWGWPATVGAVCCLSGIVLVSLDDATAQGEVEAVERPWRGVLLCLLSALVNAVVNVALHDLKDENPWVVSMYPMACTVILSAPPAFLAADFPAPSLGLWITGVFSLAAQVCRTLALQETRNMGVVVLRYLDVPFSVVLECVFLKQYVVWRTGVGVGLVVLGGVVSVWWSA